MISTDLATRLRPTAVLLIAVGGAWMAPTALAQTSGTEGIGIERLTRKMGVSQNNLISVPHPAQHRKQLGTQHRRNTF